MPKRKQSEAVQKAVALGKQLGADAEDWDVTGAGGSPKSITDRIDAICTKQVHGNFRVGSDPPLPLPTPRAGSVKQRVKFAADHVDSARPIDFTRF